MKPTSIVSLIIAVLLVVLGLVTCMVAQNMATANGEFLFSETREDGLVNTVDLTNSEISKIELIVTDAEINIIGGAKEACIEFVNFRENYYNLSAANRVLSFSEIPDITSMLKFWENGFSFKGMRYILNFKKDQEQAPDAKKIINLYLTSDKEIKIFDIQADTCKLNIEKMSSATDYIITVDNADITAKGMKTSSHLSVNAKEDIPAAQSVTFTMTNASIAYLDVNAKELNLDADAYRTTGETNIVCDAGVVDIGTVKRPESMKIDLSTENGTITVDGVVSGDTFTHATQDAEAAKITVKTKTADIKLGYIGTSTEDASGEGTGEGANP